MELSKLYSEYKIYPQNAFHTGTPVRVFQDMLPDNYFSKDINAFLEYHNYKATKRGADLPWWGEKYFICGNDKKYMIVSRDSLSPNAGSVVFYAHLMQQIKSRQEYEHYCGKLDMFYQKFKFGSWLNVLKTLTEWKIDLDNLFITDASKVYMEESDKKFDKIKSKELLIREIKLCSPDILILLGDIPFNLLSKDYTFAEVVDNARLLEIEGIKTVVSPFPTGLGRTRKDFRPRMNKTTALIHSLCSS